SSIDLTTPGISNPPASVNERTVPGCTGSVELASKAAKRSRGSTCTLPLFTSPKAFSAGRSTSASSSTRSPSSTASKPGSRLPSPMVKVPGVPSKLLSTTEPSASSSEKCRVTRQPGPIPASAGNAGVRDSGIASQLPAATDVVHTAAAQLRVLLVCAHVAAMVPATHALPVCGRRDLQPQTRNLGVGQSFRCTLKRRDAGLRYHQYKAQFIAQLRQRLAQGFLTVEGGFGAQGGANALFVALQFQFLVDGGLHFHDRSPERVIHLTSLREGLLAVGKQGQEDRGRALSRNALPDLVRRETEDRRDGTTENLYNVIHRGLGGASRQTVGAGGVLPI